MIPKSIHSHKMWIWTRGSFIKISSELRSKRRLSWKKALSSKCCLHQSSQSCYQRTSCSRRAMKEHRFKRKTHLNWALCTKELVFFSCHRTSVPPQDRHEEAPYVATSGVALAGESTGLSLSNRLDKALLSQHQGGLFNFLTFIWIYLTSPANPLHPFLTTARSCRGCGLTRIVSKFHSHAHHVGSLA